VIFGGPIGTRRGRISRDWWGDRQENRRFRGLAGTESGLLISVFFCPSITFFALLSPPILGDVEEVQRFSDDGVLITLGVSLVVVSILLDIEFRNTSYWMKFS